MVSVVEAAVSSNSTVSPVMKSVGVPAASSFQFDAPPTTFVVHALLCEPVQTGVSPEMISAMKLFVLVSTAFWRTPTTGKTDPLAKLAKPLPPMVPV